MEIILDELTYDVYLLSNFLKVRDKNTLCCLNSSLCGSLVKISQAGFQRS